MENQSGASSSLIEMEFIVPQEVEFIQVADDGLFQWEFVNVLDGVEVDVEEEVEIEDCRRKETDYLDSSISFSLSLNEVDQLIDLNEDTKEEDHLGDENDGENGGSRHSDDVVGRKNCAHHQLLHCDHFSEKYDGKRYSQYGGYMDKEGVEQENDEYGYDGYDLNDELVPWSVSSKFGRERMRKLGKRTFPKMIQSKRSPYLFMKPGCVHGKHGLGLKHSC